MQECLIFIVVPSKKKEKERKRKERLRGRKKSIRLSSEETASKKRVRHDW